jgi:hypothetical protein
MALNVVSGMSAFPPLMGVKAEVPATMTMAFLDLTGHHESALAPDCRGRSVLNLGMSRSSHWSNGVIERSLVGSKQHHAWRMPSPGTRQTAGDAHFGKRHLTRETLWVDCRRDRSFIMATSTVPGPMLFIKKLWGLLYIVLGCLGIAIGYETGSTWLIAAGIVALVVGVSLLALKVIRRNAVQ